MLEKEQNTIRRDQDKREKKIKTASRNEELIL